MSRLKQQQRPRPRPPARVRAGGRSERVRRDVARACLDLLAEDRLELGPVEVAHRAGVSRATIHRWWPTREDLLREALALHTSVLDVPDTGSWAGDLRALATELAAFFGDPTEVSLNAIMASGSQPELTRAVLAHYAPLFDDWRAVVERARSRGEVRPDVDADAVLLTLTAPFLVLPLLLRGAATDDQVAQIVDLVLAATVP